MHEEVVRERIEHVRRLLETSAAPIADIAAADDFPADAHRIRGLEARASRRARRDAAFAGWKPALPGGAAATFRRVSGRR